VVGTLTVVNPLVGGADYVKRYKKKRASKTKPATTRRAVTANKPSGNLSQQILLFGGASKKKKYVTSKAAMGKQKARKQHGGTAEDAKAMKRLEHLWAMDQLKAKYNGGDGESDD
jgi:hypothetical protein